MTAKPQGSPKKTSRSQKTYSAKPAEALAARAWWVVDAEGKPLGRLASRIATVLRGKNKATFTPHVDTGDFVIVVNADKVLLTGRKLEEKEYDHFTGYPGGLKVETAKNLLARRPENVIERGVKGMLPKNRLGRKMYKKLFVYAGAEHPHGAQQPKEFKY